MEKHISEPKSIAVLPFVNMSSNSENEYFSDGITEEIINALAKIPQLKVTSRTSSFYFKDKNFPVTELAEKLGVSILLEGSVRLAGELLRITAQLIEAKNDYHFWSETWDRKIDRIFDVQDEISLLIADKIREQFGHITIPEKLIEQQTEHITSYNYYLKGLNSFRKWNPTNVEQAMAFFNSALEIDPNHTESIIALADCYSFMATTGFMPVEEAWGTCKSLTDKAKMLNDNLPHIYYQLANIAFFTECNYSASFDYTEQALAINDNYSEAHQFMAFLYTLSGNKNLAERHIQQALDIDPLSQETLFYSGYISYMTGDSMKALGAFNKCLKHNPQNIPAYTMRLYSLLKQGNWQEVLSSLEQMPEEITVPADKLGITALCNAAKGDMIVATKLLKDLQVKAKDPQGFREDSYVFLYYGFTEKINEAYEWLENAIKNKSLLVLLHFNDPLVDSIKKDSRFLLFKELLFPDSAKETIVMEKKQLLDNEEVAVYASKLLNHIQKAMPYLDASISLRSLAEQLSMHPNQLSWLLNERFQKNFNEFINGYRIATFLELAKSPEHKHLSIIGLAFECGFNSKTVFNTTFKKETGSTPKEYIKHLA